MKLFHLTTRSAWAAALTHGEYRTDSLANEGFIHLSTETQWPLTQRRFFSNVPELVLLVVDAALLRAPVRFEAADGDAFPHLYGSLNLDAVVETRDLFAVS